MAKISTYPVISIPTFNDLLIGTDVENLNETKNFTLGDIASLIVIGNYVPYVGALEDVFLDTFNISANSFINTNGTVSDFLKADGSLDSTVYQPAGNYITSLTGQATASGPGAANVTLSNSAVIGKVLTGLTITGGSVSATDSILTAFGKVQNQLNGLIGGVVYKGTWNASTNIPLIQSGVGTQGWYYVVSVAGSTNIDGITDWNVGDWIIFDGTSWEQVDNTDTVVSVNGQVGIVVLTTTNIAEGTNLYFTDSRARSAFSLTTTGSSGAATYIGGTGVLNIPNYTLSGLGGVPSSRQLSINGTSYDLTADRTWSVGTVTSVGTSGPLTGGTITGSGTIGITQASGSTDGYLSSTDWTTFNNKQNALTNPVTGTGTIYYLPMWSGTSALTDSILSYSSNVVTFNYNSASGGTVNYTNTNGTPYTYTIQMNNATAPRQTYHSYTDGNILQQINGNVVSKNLQSGQFVLPYYISTSSFAGTAVGVLGFDSLGNIITSSIPITGLTSVGLSMPSAFTVTNSPLTSNGTIAVTGAGTSSQYIRGDGSLATIPSTSNGGSSVNYYLNGSVAASVAGYQQMANSAIIGTGTDFTLVGNGLIAQFLTDVANPNRLLIPGGAWNFEMYFNISSSGGNTKFYVELLKYDGTTFTSIASSSAIAEQITGGTTVDLYVTSLAVPETVLLTTDRLAVRVYIVDNSGGRTVTLHTEDNTLCEIITTFAGGIAALNGLTANTQYFSTGTSGTDFNILSATDTHTFNLPTASAANRGALSSADWSTFNGKQDAITLTTTGTSGAATLISNTLNIPQYSGTNLYNADGTLTGNRILTSGGYNLTFTGSNTAASAIARGLYLTPTLVASANNDVLAALDINPTFTLGAFTGVSSLGLRVTGDVTFNTGNVTRFSVHNMNNDFVGGLSTYNALLGVSNLFTLTANGSYYGIVTANYALSNGFNTQLYGQSIRAYVSGNTISGTIASTGITMLTSRSDTNDINTTTSGTLIGINSTVNQSNSATINNSLLVNYESAVNVDSGNASSVYGIRQTLRNTSFTSRLTSTITNYYGFYHQAFVGTTATVSGTVTNFYSLYLATPTVGATGTITNRWGVYAPDSVMKHHINGNVLIGTTTDAGFKLDVNGTARVSGALTVTGSTTAASAIARGANFTPTLVAAANSDVLVGLDINPTFTNGAFTGVANCAIRLGTFPAGSTPTPLNINMGGTFSSTGGQGLKLKLFDTNTNSSSLYGFTVSASNLDYVSGGGGHSFYNGGSATLIMRLSSLSGNLIIQNGGTFTDGGQRLQVTGTSYFSDSVGIGITPNTNYGIRLARTITSNVDSNGISSEGQVQSDVTSSANIFNSVSNTQNASFTITGIRHYRAVQGTFGASSVVTNQFGFLVESNLTGATSNFGFYGNIPSGTNRWNLYMNGTANNYLAGNLLIGTTTDAGQKLQVTGTSAFTGQMTVTGGVTTTGSSAGYSFHRRDTSAYVGGWYSAAGNLTLDMTVVGTALEFAVTTGIATFVNNIISSKNQNARTSITVSNTTAGTTSNAAFLSTSVNGTMSMGKVSSTYTTVGTVIQVNDAVISNSTNGDISIYNNVGTGRIKFASNASTTPQMVLSQTGNLLIGTTTDSTYKLDLVGSQRITTTSTALASLSLTNTSSVVNASTYGITSDTTVNVSAAASYTGSIVQTGVQGSLTLNFAGAATVSNANPLAGIIAIGTTNITTGTVTVTQGTTQNIIRAVSSIYAQLQFASPSTGTLSHYANVWCASPNGLTGSLTVTNYYGILLQPALASSSGITATNSWGVYQEGAADKNYFAGNVSIGTNSPNASALLQIDSTTQGVLFPRMTTTQKNAISTPAAGLVVYDSTLGKLCVRTASAWETITSI